MGGSFARMCMPDCPPPEFIYHHWAFKAYVVCILLIILFVVFWPRNR